MIDLTPLEVRKKKGDFRRGLRGYDPPQVDDFLDIVADRLEAFAPTGPMFGHDMRGPTPGSDAAAREEAILRDEGIEPNDFRRVARLAGHGRS